LLKGRNNRIDLLRRDAVRTKHLCNLLALGVRLLDDFQFLTLPFVDVPKVVLAAQKIQKLMDESKRATGKVPAQLAMAVKLGLGPCLVYDAVHYLKTGKIRRRRSGSQGKKARQEGGNCTSKVPKYRQLAPEVKPLATEEGLSINIIAKKLKIDVQTASRAYRYDGGDAAFIGNGKRGGLTPPTKLALEQQQALRKDAAAGVSQKALAQKYGVSPQTIGRCLRRLAPKDAAA